MVRATENDLQVSKPWGDSRSYDFVVGRPAAFCGRAGEVYHFELEERLDVHGGQQRKPYRRGRLIFWPRISFMRMPGTSFRGRSSGDEVGLAAYEFQPLEV